MTENEFNEIDRELSEIVLHIEALRAVLLKRLKQNECYAV